MSTTSAYATPEAGVVPAQPSSLFSRIAKVFVAPGELFEEFKETAPWGGPLLVTLTVGIIAGLAIFFMVPTETYAELIRNDMLAKGGQVPPDDIMAKIVPQAKLIGLIAGIFGPLVAALIIASILFVVCRLAMGGKASFNQYLAVTTHVQLVLMVGGLLTAPLVFMRRDPSISLGLNLVFSSLTPKSPVFGIFHSLDVFHVWALALTAVGVAKIDGRRSWVSSAVAITAVYLALTVGVPFLFSLVFAKPGA
jgi:hypothetical protein